MRLMLGNLAADVTAVVEGVRYSVIRCESERGESYRGFADSLGMSVVPGRGQSEEVERNQEKLTLLSCSAPDARLGRFEVDAVAVRVFLSMWLL